MTDQRIIRFIRRHHVLTLATADACGKPYCAHAFYCYDPQQGRLIFTSDETTLHARHMARQPEVAFSVAVETRVVGRVQGLQGRGTVLRAGDEAARQAYVKRFPYAALATLTLWSIIPSFLKLTDNTLGFGKKLIWNASE